MPVSPEDVSVKEIDTSADPQYMDHEKVYEISAPSCGLKAFAGVHNTALGPGLGGIRYKPYDNEAQAISDVLRLSEAMTWKNAAGGLDHGGGKTVVMAQPGLRRASQDMLQALAHGLDKINAPKPVYYGAEDMNFGEDQIDYMAGLTQWVKGATSKDASIAGGNPSPLTALGVFECMKVAAADELKKDSLKGLRVSMQGLGSVGFELACLLNDAGAVLIGCDINDEVFGALAEKGVQVEKAGIEDIYDVPADVFAPNAIGGTLTDEHIERLHKAGVKIVCGAANNQQQDQKGNAQSRLMHKLGILYCPDYIVNAGGVIWVAFAGIGKYDEITEHIRKEVRRNFENVLDLHRKNPDINMGRLALEYSRKRVEDAASRQLAASA